MAISKEKIEEMAPEIVMQQIMQEIFPEFLREEKVNLKDMSKKEMIEYAFAAGASSASLLIFEMGKEGEKLFKGKIQKDI